MMYRSSGKLAIAYSFASPMCAPWITTFAPKARHFSTFAIGATVGITTVAGIPSSFPCHASACAWLPADAAITPIARCSWGSESSALRAPRSLKLPVNCCCSCFR